MDRDSVGQTVWDPSTGGFEIWLRGAQAVECLSLWELWEGNQGWRLLCWGPLRICGRALDTGISFYRGPVFGNLEEGSSTRDFERWMKGALR
jgi:hypothetical protein